MPNISPINHLELIAWALCNGWSAVRGDKVVIMTSPDGRVFDVALDHYGIPLPDYYLGPAIKGGMEFPGPTEAELEKARAGT